MNGTTCDCPENSAVPLFFLSLCLSITALIASFFTHEKLQSLSIDGYKEYGRIETSSR